MYNIKDNESTESHQPVLLELLFCFLNGPSIALMWAVLIVITILFYFRTVWLLLFMIVILLITITFRFLWLIILAAQLALCLFFFGLLFCLSFGTLGLPRLRTGGTSSGNIFLIHLVMSITSSGNSPRSAFLSNLPGNSRFFNLHEGITFEARSDCNGIDGTCDHTFCFRGNCGLIFINFLDKGL